MLVWIHEGEPRLGTVLDYGRRHPNYPHSPRTYALVRDGRGEAWVNHQKLTRAFTGEAAGGICPHEFNRWPTRWGDRYVCQKCGADQFVPKGGP